MSGRAGPGPAPTSQVSGVLGRAILLSLFLAGACWRPASSSVPVGGCAAAIQARADAQAEIDSAASQAAARNRARAQQLQAIAQQGKQDVANTADLAPCDAGKPAAGVAADAAELRVRFQAVVDRTAAQLDQTAALPVIKKDDKGKHQGD
jgi:hypothetical protein